MTWNISPISPRIPKRLNASTLLLLISIPFGIALQNFIYFVVFLLLGSLIYSRRFSDMPKGPNTTVLNNKLSLGLSLLLGMHITVSLAGALNFHEQNLVVDYLADHFFFISIPVMYTIAGGVSSLEHYFKAGTIGKYFFWLVLLLSLVVVSQGVWGWNVVNNIPAFDTHRPSGLFNNALTLAYVLMFFFPIVSYNFVKKPSSLFWTTLFVSLCAALVATNSRMILIVSMFVFVFNLLSRLQSVKKRLMGIALIIATCVIVLSTPNKVSYRFASLLTSLNKSAQTQENVPPRLVFWKAHLEMLAAKPIIGHGPSLTAQYRRPYYEKSGGAYLDRPSTAHNQYLQTATNGGLVGLLCFLGFLSLCYSASKNDLDFRSHKKIAQQIIICFIIAGMTQNAFQDSEVRNTFMVFFTWLLAHTSMEAEASREENTEALPC